MHQTMLDGHLNQSAVGKRWQGGIGSKRARKKCIELCADIRIVGFNYIARRPVGGLVGWQIAVHRIDAEGKEFVKYRVERLEATHTSEQIPVECF